MSDETKSALLEPGCRPAAPPGFANALRAPPGRPWSFWLRRLLACNPFYLVSAALLLFGLNRVSVDPDFLRTELAQLTFNFSALQLYELLLVGTAIALARRAVWYDSTLLLVLENLFVLVPFMLVSQAAFMTRGLVWTFCALAVALVAARAGAAQRWFAAPPRSPRLLACGVSVLVVNAALPMIYRDLHEFKVGTKPTSGAAFAMNEQSWLWLLPTLCALTSLLPHTRNDGKLPVQRRWFPVTLLLLWLAGTGVHLYSLGYVYDFELRRELLAPTLWVLAWVVHLRLKDFVAEPGPALRAATLALPLLATLPAVGVAGSRVGFVLTALSVAGFAYLALFERDNRAARHWLLVALALLAAALPREWTGPAWAEFGGQAHWLALAATAYVVLRAAVSRHPQLALAGAVAAALLVGVWRAPSPDALPWAAQVGLVFCLLHGLRWRDYAHEGAAMIRLLTACAWVLHSGVWVRADAVFWHPPAVGALVLATCWLHWWLCRKRPPLAVPLAAGLVAMLSPANWAFAQLQATPLGLLAVTGSFLLFAIGTAAAFSKPRWLRPV